ncbi:hypothetical protein PRIPAC_79825, partial [Pristionchus pacificus]|uniref:Ribosomal protein n=1 Tax=Pristionchus pacificus TaxID=54126 RepID=A0A2A6CNY7_PRIPA
MSWTESRDIEKRCLAARLPHGCTGRTVDSRPHVLPHSVWKSSYVRRGNRLRIAALVRFKRSIQAEARK